MPNNFIAKYWRRIRNEAAKKEPSTAEERNESNYKNEIEKIATAINGVAEKLSRPNNQGNSNDEWERSWKKWEVRGIWAAAAVGFIAILWSAWDSSQQRGIMQGQLDEMRADQRPALWFGSDTGQPHFEENKTTPGFGQIVWSSHIENHGKGFLAGGIVRKYLWLGNKGWAESYLEPATGTVIAPMAPTQDVYVSAISPPGLSVNEYNSLLSMSEGIRMLIRGNYRDLANINYPVSMCVSRLTTGAISFCRTNNQMK